MTDCTVPNSEKYQQIINAAVEEFQEKGFTAASMDRVSARAEVSKRTLYKYFESKENLFQSIVGVLSDRFADMMEIRYEQGRPIRDQLIDLAWVEGRLLMSPDVIAMARMVISEVLRNPVLAEKTQGKMDKTRVFADMLRVATADGQMNVPDPDEAGVEFVGLIKAKAFWPVIFGAPIVTEEQMAGIVESSVNMMMSRYGKT